MGCYQNWDEQLGTRNLLLIPLYNAGGGLFNPKARESDCPYPYGTEAPFLQNLAVSAAARLLQLRDLILQLC